MKIERVHHVQLAMPAGRERDAVAFYEGVLGIPEVDKPPHLAARGGCWFETETVKIHLGVEDPFAPARKAHPAFVVPDLEVARSRLEAGGAPIVIDQPLPGFDRLYTEDPFGNRIEILQAQR